jgi:hypothetical protein
MRFVRLGTERSADIETRCDDHGLHAPAALGEMEAERARVGG